MADTNPVSLGEVVVALVGEAPPSKPRVAFANPDIDYLTRRNEREPRFVGRMLRIFGETVVLEALRRDDKFPDKVFLGICRNVERQEGS